MGQHKASSGLGTVLVSALVKLAVAVIVLLALTQVGLAAFTGWAASTGRQAIVVTGGSMEPEFSAGDAIVVREDTSTIGTGDVVTYRTPDGLVTHRVVERTDVAGQPHLVTRGDANDDADAGLTPLADVVGVVEGSVPKGGHMIVFLASTAGRAVTLLPLLLLLAVSETRRSIRIWRGHSPQGPAAAAATTA